MKLIRIVALVFVTGLFCLTADALEIIKVKGNRVLIRLDGKTVSVGEQLDVIDASGRKKGIVRITSFNETKALAKIENGPANVGMKVTKRTGVIVDNEIVSNNNYDIRLNPIGIFFSAIDVNLDFKISQDWTVGVQGEYLHAQLAESGIYTSPYNISAYGYGVRANWFEKGVFNDGWYLGPSLQYLSVSVKTTDAFGNVAGSASGTMASCLVGYGWFWNNLNIMLGAGYGTVLGASSITIKDAVGNQETITANLSGITLEFSMGWAF